MPPGSRAWRARPPTCIEITGLPLSPHYGASKLRWCLDHLPEVRAAAAQSRLRAGPLASYLLHRLLTERPVVADAANAARTLLWSPFERNWSGELLELFGIPRAILPRAVGTKARFGTLPAGGGMIPVVACNGDQSVVPFAAGALDTRAAYVNLGTGAFVLRPTSKALRAAPLMTSVIRADDINFDFVLEGSVNGAGAALSWFELHQGAAADRMLALLDDAPLADDEAPFFLNGVAGLGSPFWNPDFESRFVGDGSELQQCRAVLESVAFLIKANLDEMDRHLDTPSRLIASGGLAENRLLCRMLAALAGVPVDRASDREATSRGLAFLVAGEPAGFRGTRDASGWIRNPTSDCWRVTSSGSSSCVLPSAPEASRLQQVLDDHTIDPARAAQRIDVTAVSPAAGGCHFQDRRPRNPVQVARQDHRVVP